MPLWTKQAQAQITRRGPLSKRREKAAKEQLGRPCNAGPQGSRCVTAPQSRTHSTRQAGHLLRRGTHLTSTNSACSDHLLHLQDNHTSKETKRLTDTDKKLVVTNGGRSRGVRGINYLVYDRLKDASHNTENTANILQ